MTPDDGVRPGWSERLQRERKARGWSQADAVRAMRAFSDVPLPDGLLDQWKRWERGRNRPDEFYRPIIAAALGTVVESIFPSPRPAPVRRTADEVLLTRSGMTTHELVARLRRSSVDDATLDGLAATVEQLRCDYAQRDPIELARESREWLGRATALLDERLTLPQHRDVLDAAAWLTLLVGTLEHDVGRSRDAEATRVAALQLGEEAGNASVLGWAYELRAWFALDAGRYDEVVDAAQAGQAAAPGRSVAVQLLAQEAKAWARRGDRRNTVRALERGRVLLDALPYPERPEDHFVVDPDKHDFYAMDCYRLIGDDALAEMHAREILRRTVDPDGRETSPMRRAEAEITLGVVAARAGDPDAAARFGASALSKERLSLPSLLRVAGELDRVLRERYPTSAGTRDFSDALLALSRR